MLQCASKLVFGEVPKRDTI